MSSLKNLLFLGIFLGSFLVQGLASVDYELALSKSLLYFEAQRSGKLPPNQRVTWRNDSGLRDGSDVEMDLTGGYHDAGDNIKLGFPMAFTTTMLAWSFIEGEISSKERDNLLQAIKWATDYFIKAHPEPEVLYGVVGDGDADHACWERPEDMTTPRYAYKIDAQNPGSDLAAETAAALAAASIVFTGIDTTYSAELILHAKQLFDFAHDHPGYYQNSIPKGYFYSSTGFEDELLWAAAWLHHATGAQRYLDCLASSTDGGGYINLFSWDNKLIGAQLYVAKLILEGKLENTGVWAKYKSNVDEYICSILQKGSNNIPRTPGGLLYNNLEWSPLQYITTSSLAAVVYAKYLDHEKKQLQCQGGVLNSDDLHAFARSQVDYILGLNPKNMSYMVGFGANYPQKIHHRASSIVSIKKNDTLVTCQGGFDLYFHRNESDLNVLEGAIVGGPDQNDGYTDSRESYKQSEPSTIIVAPFIGILARLMIAYH